MHFGQIFLFLSLAVVGAVGQRLIVNTHLDNNDQRQEFHKQQIQQFEQQTQPTARTEKQKLMQVGQSLLEEPAGQGVDQEQEQGQGQGQEKGGEEAHYHHPTEMAFWINALLATFLTCVGGFCSGLTVGLLGIDTMQLEMMSMSKDEEEKRKAANILKVVSNHHLFLVTLLLSNAIALESLPLVVHSLMPDWMAIIFSTFIVLIIGEIVPQAYCTGPNKISIASFASPLILVMIKALWIVSYPMAKGLDYLLGHHVHQRIQHKDFARFLSDDKMLKQTEVLLLTEILQLRCERVTDIMVPIFKLYMLSIDETLSNQKVEEIKMKDYSYILIYKERRENVVGAIKTKEFALDYVINSGQNSKLTIKDVVKQHSQILSVYADTNLLQMLMLFQANSMRVALVCEEKKKVVPGIQSIMYSKNDMVMKNKGSKIIGVVFLYQIFEEIASYCQQLPVQQKQEGREMKNMEDLKQPLLKLN